MANSIQAFFQTLKAAEGDFNQAKIGQVALLDGVHMDVKSEAATVGQTINVPFPDVGPMSPVNNGILTTSPVNPNYAPMVFNTRVGKALQFQDFERWQTSEDLAREFLKPLYYRAAEYLNGQIASLATPANFGANAPIIGSVQGEVQVPDMLNAWSALADQKVMMSDPDDLSLFVHNQVQRKMFADSAWVQENIISAAVAEKARTQARLANAYNFGVIWDQQMPTSSASIITGQVQLVNGSPTVNGLATGFTTQLAVGGSLTFVNDPAKGVYTISTITSDTQLTLSANYTGPSTAANTGTVAKTLTLVTGTVGATNGSAAVTGSGTSFTTQLSVGQWLTFSGDATKGVYQIASITSATALTLATNYAGATLAGQTATVQSFNCLAMHRYAIGLALRPIGTPPQADGVVDVTYLDLKGIPVRVMVSYQHIYQATYVTLDYGYALAVLRPDFGQLIQV